MDANTIGSIGQGIAQGLERGIQNTYNIQNQGVSQRLQIQKMAEDSQYKQQMLNMQQDQSKVQIEQMQLQIDGLKQAKLKETTHNAINGYLTDGNPRWLNGALQENPELQKLFGGITRIEPLNSNSQDDIKMFEAAGGVTMDDPSVLKRYVKAIDNSGNISLVDTFGLAQKTGAFKQWNDEQLKTRLTEAQIAEHNAKATKYSMSGDGSEPTAMQKNFNWLNKSSPELAQKFLAKETGYAPTTSTKEMLVVDEAKAKIVEQNPKFFETTYTPGTDEYRQMEPNIQKIEKAMGIKMNSTDKKEIADIKRIITLSDTAKELTPEDTGMVDNLVGNVSKYISDKAPSEAKNAYNQMMTTVRNSLYGATVPAAEMSSFTQAFGSLYQQDKAVKSAMKTSLEAMKAKMEAFTDTGDEAVTHFRYGADATKLNKIINNIDSMLGAIDGKQQSKQAIKPNIPLPSKTATSNTSEDYKTPPPVTATSYKDGTKAKNKVGDILTYRTGKGWVAE